MGAFEHAPILLLARWQQDEEWTSCLIRVLRSWLAIPVFFDSLRAMLKD